MKRNKGDPRTREGEDFPVLCRMERDAMSQCRQRWLRPELSIMTTTCANDKSASADTTHATSDGFHGLLFFFFFFLGCKRGVMGVPGRLGRQGSRLAEVLVSIGEGSDARVPMEIDGD